MITIFKIQKKWLTQEKVNYVILLTNRRFNGETMKTKVKAHTYTKSSKGSMSTAN